MEQFIWRHTDGRSVHIQDTDRVSRFVYRVSFVTYRSRINNHIGYHIASCYETCDMNFLVFALLVYTSSEVHDHELMTSRSWSYQVGNILIEAPYKCKLVITITIIMSYNKPYCVFSVARVRLCWYLKCFSKMLIWHVHKTLDLIIIICVRIWSSRIIIDFEANKSQYETLKNRSDSKY